MVLLRIHCRQLLRAKDGVGKMYALSTKGGLMGFRSMRGMATTSAGINKYSKNITQPKSQGASQAMRIVRWSIGLTE
jgi:hypothetical protein